MYLSGGTGEQAGRGWGVGLGVYDSRRSRLIHFLITEKYMVLPATAQFNLQPRQTAAESALYGGTRANRWRAFLPALLPQGRLRAPLAAPLLYSGHTDVVKSLFFAPCKKKKKEKTPWPL